MYRRKISSVTIEAELVPVRLKMHRLWCRTDCNEHRYRNTGTDILYWYFLILKKSSNAAHRETRKPYLFNVELFQLFQDSIQNF
jgi:hypothetical protein